jgi:hypothetical protein
MEFDAFGPRKRWKQINNDQPFQLPLKLNSVVAAKKKEALQRCKRNKMVPTREGQFRGQKSRGPPIVIMIILVLINHLHAASKEKKQGP